MPIRSLTLFFAATALTLTSVTAAMAGDPNADQFKLLLTKQALNLGKPRGLLGGGGGDLGTGRGLVLAPGQSMDLAADAGKVTQVVDTSYVTYTQLPEDMQLNIQINFDFDSAALREDEKPRLASMCEAMQGVDIETFQIVGHTDAKGAQGYNEQLSLLRAEEVKRHLVTDCGIEASRLQAVGVGESFPLDPNNPEAEENRRVEFQALS